MTQPSLISWVCRNAIALRNQTREEYGFNDPLLAQYISYLGRVVTLDFGESHYYKESVWTVMFSRIPWSMVLTVSSMILSILFGLIFGAAAGKRRDKAADKVLLWLSGVTTAIPSFWLAMVKVFPYRGAMTAGYTLSMDGTPFLIVFAACMAGTVVYNYTAEIGADGTFSYAVTFDMGGTVYDGSFVFTDSEGNVTEGNVTAENTLVISLMASAMAKEPYEVTFTPSHNERPTDGRYRSNKSRHLKTPSEKSPVRSCTELGFYGSERPRAACYDRIPPKTSKYQLLSV